jgi:hypothetical protein
MHVGFVKTLLTKYCIKIVMGNVIAEFVTKSTDILSAAISQPRPEAQPGPIHSHELGPEARPAMLARPKTGELRSHQAKAAETD